MGGGEQDSYFVLSHTLPVCLSQFNLGTHLEVGQLWLSLYNHITDPHNQTK